MTKRQPSTIVRTSYRYKPPPRKRKTAPLAGPAVATKRATLPGTGKRAANDDRKLVAAKKPALIITASRKLTKLRRAELALADDDDPEATARMKAFFAQMIRPGGALPPENP
jgi:hypothetical protein